MSDKLRRELELFREMRALIKQAEVEARLACSHMVEAEHLPAAMAAVPFGLDPTARAYETALTNLAPNSDVEAHPALARFCRCPVAPSCTAQPRRAR